MVDVNLLAVFVAAIVGMIIGFLWYSPFLFGKMWMKLMGFTMEKMSDMKKKGMTKVYVLNFIFTVVMAYVLAHFLLLMLVADVGGAIELSFWLWIGFIVPLLVGNVLWENKSWKLFALNAGYWLASMIGMAIVLVLWY
jgi:hypothetical protein